MGAQACRAQRQQQRRFSWYLGFDQRDSNSGPLQRRHGLTGRQPRKLSASLRDIPPCGKVERSGHPA
jgi:hypothetical protein